MGGSVRTLDPERPLAAALVLAGSGSPPCSTTPPRRRRARGASTSTAAASLPGFVDAHVHFPSWALARRELRLFGCRVAGRGARASAARRPRRAARRLAARARLARRAAGASTADARRRSTRSRPGCRVALRGARRPLAVAELGRAAAADGELAVPGGVVETRRRGRADRHPARGVRVAVLRHARRRDLRRDARRDARRAAGGRRAPASPASTTRTAGAARPSCSPRCATPAS